MVHGNLQTSGPLESYWRLRLVGCLGQPLDGEQALRVSRTATSDGGRVERLLQLQQSVIAEDVELALESSSARQSRPPSIVADVSLLVRNAAQILTRRVFGSVGGASSRHAR